jgi:hypothetical protein
MTGYFEEEDWEGGGQPYKHTHTHTHTHTHIYIYIYIYRYIWMSFGFKGLIMKLPVYFWWSGYKNLRSLEDLTANRFHGHHMKLALCKSRL